VLRLELALQPVLLQRLCRVRSLLRVSTLRRARRRLAAGKQVLLLAPALHHLER